MKDVSSLLLLWMKQEHLDVGEDYTKRLVEAEEGDSEKISLTEAPGFWIPRGGKKISFYIWKN